MKSLPRSLVVRVVVLVAGGLTMGLVLALYGSPVAGVVVALGALVGPPSALVMAAKYGTHKQK